MKIRQRLNFSTHFLLLRSFMVHRRRRHTCIAHMPRFNFFTKNHVTYFTGVRESKRRRGKGRKERERDIQKLLHSSISRRPSITFVSSSVVGESQKETKNVSTERVPHPQRARVQFHAPVHTSCSMEIHARRTGKGVRLPLAFSFERSLTSLADCRPTQGGPSCPSSLRCHFRFSGCSKQMPLIGRFLSVQRQLKIDARKESIFRWSQTLFNTFCSNLASSLTQNRIFNVKCKFLLLETEFDPNTYKMKSLFFRWSLPSLLVT